LEDLPITAAGSILLIVNLAGFLLMGLDKKRAISRKKRVREDLLLLLACMGGSPGVYAGMRVFRHKTRKALFALGVPILMILQSTALWMQLSRT